MADQPMTLPAIGTSAGGGIVGGYISTNQDGVATHALIVADAALLTSTYSWKNADTETTGADSLIDGPSNFAAMVAASHPIAQQVKTTLNDADHGGFSDWYIPAIAELDVLYQELKPTTDNNSTSGAINNPWAVPSRVSGDRTTGSPAQTSVAAFQSGGAQAFASPTIVDSTDYYASSTQVEFFGTKGNAEAIAFLDGSVASWGKTSDFLVRPIRRLSLADVPPTPEQQFDSTYADVSGRDPLPTALNQRTPAQNLVDYLVSLYAGTNPRIVVKPVQIELGELDKTSPAPASGDLSRQIWIEDDRDPNFVGGRWATVLGRSGGADPGTVELTLFIADNSESFVEPT